MNVLNNEEKLSSCNAPIIARTHPLLQRDDMAPLNQKFAEKYLDFYKEFTKGHGRLAKPISPTICNEKLLNALKDVGVRNGAGLAKILGLKNRRGSIVWSDPKENLTAANMLLLKEWAHDRLRLCEDQLLPEEEKRNIPPERLDQSLLDPPTGWKGGKRSDPVELKPKYEALLCLLANDYWINENQDLIKDEFLRRVAFEYTRLLDPMRFSTLITIGTMLLGAATPQNAPWGGIDMFYLLTHLSLTQKARFFPLVEGVIRAQPVASRKNVCPYETLPILINVNWDTWLKVLRFRLQSTRYGSDVSYSDLAGVVADPAGMAFWQLNHVISDDVSIGSRVANPESDDASALEREKHETRLACNAPATSYPFEVLAEYCNQKC